MEEAARQLNIRFNSMSGENNLSPFKWLPESLSTKLCKHSKFNAQIIKNLQENDTKSRGIVPYDLGEDRP